MSAQFGGITIGAMQFNGVKIGEAMMDGLVVYRSAIQVTPPAPTFLPESPWVVLPTAAGVSYAITGTPGYLQSVTVTASALPGYRLVGTSSWSHTFPSRYPTGGEFTSTVTSNGYATYLTHTITEAGNRNFTLTSSHVSGGLGIGLTATSRIVGPWGTSTDSSGVSVWRDVAVGDVIQFQVGITSSINSPVIRGVWRIS